MTRKLYDTANGGKSKYAQPNKARYYKILQERDRRLIELGFTKKPNVHFNEDIKSRIKENSCVDPISGCWIWTKALQYVGYGFISAWNEKKQRYAMRTVHRVSFEEFVGPIPKGRIVAHTCDTTFCCNPEHLWIGTRKQNTADMVRKGRASTGPGTKDMKKFYKGEEWRFFKPGTEPDGWIQCNSRKSDRERRLERQKGNYKLSEQSRANIRAARLNYLARMEAAKQLTAGLITQLQANTQPDLV